MVMPASDVDGDRRHAAADPRRAALLGAKLAGARDQTR